MEQITPEEMKAGTQPTRSELIMFTPLEEVLAKDSWNDIDVEILVANRHVLPADVLVKLGITQPAPLTPEEVAAQVAALGPVPEEVVPEVTPEAPVAEEVAPEVVGEIATAAAVENTEAPVGETVDNAQA